MKTQIIWVVMKVQKKLDIYLNGYDLQRPVKVVASDSAIQL